MDEAGHLLDDLHVAQRGNQCLVIGDDVHSSAYDGRHVRQPLPPPPPPLRRGRARVLLRQHLNDHLRPARDDLLQRHLRVRHLKLPEHVHAARQFNHLVQESPLPRRQQVDEVIGLRRHGQQHPWPGLVAVALADLLQTLIEPAGERLRLRSPLQQLSQRPHVRRHIRKPLRAIVKHRDAAPPAELLDGPLVTTQHQQVRPQGHDLLQVRIEQPADPRPVLQFRRLHAEAVHPDDPLALTQCADDLGRVRRQRNDPPGNRARRVLGGLDRYPSRFARLSWSAGRLSRRAGRPRHAHDHETSE